MTKADQAAMKRLRRFSKQVKTTDAPDGVGCQGPYQNGVMIDMCGGEVGVMLEHEDGPHHGGFKRTLALATRSAFKAMEEK